MSRNKNVEAVRGIAIIYMLLYHYVSSISGFKLDNRAALLIESLCQFGLISFYVISGYGIYTLLNKMENLGEPIKFKQLISRRFYSILPSYYLCLVFILIFTTQVAWLEKKSIKVY